MSRPLPKELLDLLHQHAIPKAEYRYINRYWRDVRAIERTLAQQYDKLEVARRRLRAELLRASEADREESTISTPGVLELLSMVPPPEDVCTEGYDAASRGCSG